MHQMHSKWLDVGMCVAAFHLQSSRYNSIKPPSFGSNPHLTSLERERERLNEPTREEVENQIDETLEKEKETNGQPTSRFSKWLKKRKKYITRNNGETTQAREQGNHGKAHKKRERRTSLDDRIRQTGKNINAPATPKPHHQHKKKRRGHRRVATALSTIPSPLAADPDALDERPLFLQEAAHLLSLLSAVAFSTLRNDLEHAESPLIPFEPGVLFLFLCCVWRLV